MTTYDDETTAVHETIAPMLTYAANLVEVFRDEEGSIIVVLRPDTDEYPEMMLKLISEKEG